MPRRSRQSSTPARRRAQLVEICRRLPEVDVSGDQHLAFRIRRKTFAYYLCDHHGDGRIALCCKAGPGVQQGLVDEDPVRFFVPPYLGHRGWIAIRLDLDQVDWGLVAELAKRAYQQLAPRRLASRVEAERK